MVASPATMRLSTLLGSASLILAGCGSDPPPPSDSRGRLDRPVLTASGEAELPKEVITPVVFPEDFSAWTIEGRSAHPSGEGAQRQLLFGAGKTGEPGRPEPVRIMIPGAFASYTFNRIVISGIFSASFEIQLQLDGEKAQAFRPPALTTSIQDAPQTLVFDLEALRGRNVAFDHLRLQITGPHRPFGLTGIDLIRMPDHLQLPQLDDEPAMVNVGEHSRRAQGLAPGVVAECSFEVQHAADQLSFCCSSPPNLRGARGKAFVELTLIEESGAEHLHRVRVPTRGGPLEWTDTDVPLADFVGQQLTARFEYRCAAQRPGLAALGEVRVWRPAAEAPLTLLISSDTHRADHVAALGASLELQGELQTPGLDGLARAGLMFEFCQATTNVTSPSHVAMLTAVHPRDTRLISNQDRLIPEARTLAEAFHEAGWRTFGVVSVRHLGPRGTDLGQGFDRMRSPLSTPWSAEEARAELTSWIDGAQGLPVFAFLHLFDAHHPYTPPDSHDRQYYPEGRDPFDPSLPALEIRRGSIPLDYWGRLRDLDFPRAQYAAEVTYLDSVLARLFQHPRVAAGLVAFTADHGEIFENAGTFFNHGELYPATLHIPLLIGGGALPEEYRGKRAPRAVSQLGLGRTLLDLSDLAHVEFPGRNLLFEVEAEGDAPSLFALSAHGHSASITRDGWFLLLHLNNHQGPLATPRKMHQVELFDLRTDLGCAREVSADEPALVDDLRAELITWLAGADPHGLSSRRTSSAAEVEALKGLGYTTNVESVEARPWYVPEGQDQ